MSRLNIDFDTVVKCRSLAQSISKKVVQFAEQHSTVSIERSILRLLGISDAAHGMALANLVVDSIPREELKRGVAHWIGRAVVATRQAPLAVAVKVSQKKLDLMAQPEVSADKLQAALAESVKHGLAGLDRVREARAPRRHSLSHGSAGRRPLKYVIVATGNIHDDIPQAMAAAKAGADIIAVIRSTAQSLIDYVPHGATTEGFGGTYATQENFRLMRQALDQASELLGRYVGLTNYSSGLCMPEIAVIGAFEGLDYLLNDAMYGILFRDINMHRTLIDQHFSRQVIARAGITIQTGEDNYLTTAPAERAGHQVLASHFINEQLALAAGLDEERIGLGHAFEMDPGLENGFLLELAQAELVREIFFKSPIKYMPPTKHMTGDFLMGNVQDALFNLVGVISDQSVQLLGMPTEAIHTPWLADRNISLKNANYIFNNARNLGEEIHYLPNGRVIRWARQVLDETRKHLEKVSRVGLAEAISHGFFAHVSRSPDGGRGLDGVFERGRDYWNPFEEYFAAPREEGETVKRTPPASKDGGRRRRRRGGRGRGARKPPE